MGKEAVEVKAGKFEASVYEVKQAYSEDGLGGGMTCISTMYMVNDIGCVKVVTVTIKKTRKIKKNPSPQRDTKVELEIQKGLEDLKNGKDPSEIAFFKDTTYFRKNENIELGELEITKNISSSELISYKAR
jgi:HJR/Mrr/RecB family endonuclease